MNSYNTDKDALIIKAFMPGLLLFVFAAFYNNDYSDTNRFEQSLVQIEAISDIQNIAITNIPANFTSLDKSLSTAGISTFNDEINNNYVLSNTRDNSEYNLRANKYLDIKPKLLSISFSYSAYQQMEYPAVS